MRQDLPGGPGLLYEGSNNVFELRSMLTSGKQYSMAAIEWLEVQGRINKWGVNIKHALNFGEQKVASHFVDGYAVIPDDPPYKIVFEFLGCRYHR